jgi:hypothetical protein
MLPLVPKQRTSLSAAWTSVSAFPSAARPPTLFTFVASRRCGDRQRLRLLKPPPLLQLRLQVRALTPRYIAKPLHQ